MKIFVAAKPGAREERVEEIDSTHFVVRVKEPAKEGRANWAVQRVLAKHLGIAPSHLRLLSGASSRQKVFEI